MTDICWTYKTHRGDGRDCNENTSVFESQPCQRTFLWFYTPILPRADYIDNHRCIHIHHISRCLLHKLIISLFSTVSLPLNVQHHGQLWQELCKSILYRVITIEWNKIYFPGFNTVYLWLGVNGHWCTNNNVQCLLYNRVEQMGLNVGRHSFIDEVWDEARKVVAVIFLKYFFHLQIKQVYVSCYFRVVSEAQRFSICSECKQIKTFLAKMHACAVHTHYERKNLSFWWRYKSFCLPLQYTVNMYGNGDTASAFLSLSLSAV